jgi:hypothetical protein
MRSQWESMSVDELFELHQLMQAVLREKLGRQERGAGESIASAQPADR